MSDRVYDLQGIRVFEFAAAGAPPTNSRDATELIGAARSQQAELAVIPAARLGDEFFRLKTGIAGEIIQKFVTYQVRLVIVGDIPRYLLESSALRDLVYESNHGTNVWFLPDLQSLASRLVQCAAGRLAATRKP